MQFPRGLDITIQIQTAVNRTESKQKIIDAINHIVEVDDIKEEDRTIIVRSSTLKTLKKVYEHIRSKSIVTTLRKQLINNVNNDDSTKFYLNKQAATNGAISLVEDPEESPLGPIIFILKSKDIQRVIDWLAPDYPEK